MAHVINKSCTKCAACLPECPTASIIEGKNQYYIDTDTCADHAACVNVCPVDAISVRDEPSLNARKSRFQEEEEEEEEL